MDCQMPNPNPAARVQCIDLGMLAGKLNMDPEAAEKWIVNLIRSARLSAKLDSQARPPCAAAPTRRAALPLSGPADAASARRRRFALGMLCRPRAGFEHVWMLDTCLRTGYGNRGISHLTSVPTTRAVP